MAVVYLNVSVFSGELYPVLTPFNTESIVVTVDDVDYSIYPDGYVSVPVNTNTTVGVTISNEGYGSYSGIENIGDVDSNLIVALDLLTTSDFINITEDCHTFTITNSATTEDDNVTYTITDLDGNVVGDNEDVVLDFETSKTFTSTSDNIYIVVVKDDEGNIIRNYVVIDYCDIRSCISNRILDILCSCGCEDCVDYCKKDFEMKRIKLLQEDLFNRINTEYRLNSYYSTLDNMRVNDLKTTEDVLDKLKSYCGNCNSDSTTITISVSNVNNSNKSGCGCS